jgi:hypothetical protein
MGESFDVVQVIILALAVLIVLHQGWKLLPSSVLFLFPSAVCSHFSTSEKEQGPVMRNRMTSSLSARLVSLGFRYLGVKSEHGPLWSPVVRELLFASPHRQAFASITGQASVPRFYFYTPCLGGRVLLTSNAGQWQVAEEGFVRQFVLSEQPEEVLAAHQQRLDALRQQGWKPFHAYTRTSSIAATDMFYASPASRRVLRARCVRHLSRLLVTVLFSGFLVVYALLL